MTTISPRQTTLACLCMATALLASMTPCRGADSTLAPAVQEAIAAVRDNFAGVYDVFESSTLGSTASPAEYAAGQRNLRQYYLTPAEPIELTEARQAELGALYGRATLVGVPRSCKAYALGTTGASVIDADGRPELTVTGIEPNSPADGKLEVGDVIIGSNNRLFPDWEDPRVPIGYAVAAAQTEAFGGMLTLSVGRAGKIISVGIKLPVDGGYGDNWPYDCKKSKAIADAAVKYVMNNGDSTFWKHLFLMGCGDWNEMALVRDELRKSQSTGGIASCWGGGYQLVSLCEYYLLTRDPKVMPAIECHVRGLEANQMLTGGWSHGPPGGYGLMHQPGQICFIGLLLARECGVEVDPTVLARAVKLSGRYIGSYIPYGDHPPGTGTYHKGGGIGDNGKVQAHAVLFDLLGEPEVGRRSARRSCYVYRAVMAGHAERIFSPAWAGVGAALAPQPEFRMFADNMLWYYELARQRSGGLFDLGTTRYGKSTAAVGMIFTLPGKRLRIAGGPRRTEPLFPIAKLDGIQVAPPQPIAEWQPVQPAAPDGKEDATARWDTLLAPEAKAGSLADADNLAEEFNLTEGYRVADAGTIDPKGATPWYAKAFAADAWAAADGPPKIGKDPAGTLLRTSFFCQKIDYTRLRLTLPSTVAGEIFLNGARVVAFPAGVRGSPPNQSIDLGERAVAALVRGENVLAAKLTGPAGTAVAIDLAAGPGTIDKRIIAGSPGKFGDFRGNGWVGTFAQHRQSVDWFFEGKSPEEIARYLPYPDWNGAQAAYEALASHGPAALGLLERLVEDSHEGIRTGAWDAISELRARGQLPDDAAARLATVAAKRAPTETGPVGAALLRAVAPLAQGDELATVLAAAAALPDVSARGAVADIARNRLKDRPDAMVNVMKVIVEGRLNHGDIAMLGGALVSISSHAKLLEARASVPAIARVLNGDAPDTRGMFSNGLMSGGLDTIDQQFDEPLEQTPLLVPGLCRCFVKVPDIDHPAWTFPNLYLRRLLYRLSTASVDRIDATVAEIAAAPDAGLNENRRAEPMAELKAWAATLRKTGGEPDALRAEALRLAASDAPAERLVALSLVWPSDRNPILGRPLNPAYQRADTPRVSDPADRLAVAAAAAKHFESNTSMHWLLIWETSKAYADRPESQQVMASLGEFFDTVAYRKRGTFIFNAIDVATELAKAQLAKPGSADTHVLARGLCKTYATAANMEWYTATRDKLQKVTLPLAASSPEAAAEAAAAIEAWLKDGPAEEKQAVFGGMYRVNPADITSRLSNFK